MENGKKINEVFMEGRFSPSFFENVVRAARKALADELEEIEIADSQGMKIVRKASASGSSKKATEVVAEYEAGGVLFLVCHN